MSFTGHHVNINDQVEFQEDNQSQNQYQDDFDNQSQQSQGNEDFQENEQNSDMEKQNESGEESDESRSSKDSQNVTSKRKKKQERIETQITEAQKKYTGQVLQEKRDGYGIEVHTQDETEYHGYWRKDLYHGEGIFFTKKEECFFKGLWKRGQKVCGIEIFPNGDQFEGEYFNEKFHGKGCLHNNSMHYRYEGEFKNGLRDGYCQNETYRDGSVYVGSFKKNQKHGKGKLVFKDRSGRDTSYYEGDFIKGVPSGFGIYVAYSYERSKSILPNVQLLKQIENENMLREYSQQDVMENTLMTEETLGYSTKRDYETIEQIDDGFNNISSKQDREEWYYEGEFVEGYKHGLGRYYEPNGSYYYCQWEFDRKVGDILYYNAANHKWRIYKYKNPDSVQDDYLPPDNKLQVRFIENITSDKTGFPPEEKDAAKCKIDECGISGDQFEDNVFLSMESSVNQIYDDNVKDIPSLSFYRMTEMAPLKNGKKELFENPIKPGEIKYNKFSDHQLITVIEALTKLPSLLQKVFTVKYELDTVCYLTLKLYINGKWREIVIDDYIPCLRVTREPLFANTDDNELGWLALQKVFCKHFGQYYYYFKPNFPQMVKQYLQMLTGLPSKTISWHNIPVKEQSDQIEQKIWKALNSVNNPAQIALCYPSEYTARKLNIQLNHAYIVLDFVRDEETMTADQYFILVHHLNPEQKVETKERDLYEFQGISQMLKNNGISKPNEYYTLFTIREFVQTFDDIHILMGMNSQVQNNTRIQMKIQDFINNDHRFFMKFQINLPTKVLFNVQQHFKEGEEPHFPIRMVLANEKDAYANTKKEFTQRKVVRSLQSKLCEAKEHILEQEKIKSQQNQYEDSDEEVQKVIGSRNATPKQSKKGIRFGDSKNVSLELKREESQPIEFQPEATQLIDPIKRKNLPYKYVFGKGQRNQENLFKTTTLKAGVYILLVQVEGPDTKAAQKKVKHVNIDLTVSLCSESLIHLERMEEPENFLRNLYEHHIYTTEMKVLNGHKIEHFSRSDLQDRERGCNDLIITQYFLRKEGTYLQYLQNQSYDKSAKSWRQKLYFRTENMKILDQQDPHKVDVHLLPQNESLVIIQQVAAKTYNLEGGEGICIIDKIGKSKVSEGEEDEEDDDGERKKISIRDFRKELQNRRQLSSNTLE